MDGAIMILIIIIQCILLIVLIAFLICMFVTQMNKTSEVNVVKPLSQFNGSHAVKPLNDPSHNEEIIDTRSVSEIFGSMFTEPSPDILMYTSR